jgi:squalene-hopene/tetraprenyl-beta-curcumene cyclase
MALPMHFPRILSLSLAVVIGLASPLVSRPAAAGPDAEKLDATVKKGVEFLKKSQSEDGTWTSAEVPGITSLCVYSLLKSGVEPTDPTVAKGLKFIDGLKKEDGGIYREGTRHKNYETAISIIALEAANKDGKYDETIKKAADFVRGIQFGGPNQKSDPSEIQYGGAGYGQTGTRPDMSNTTFFLDALKAAGAKSDDPAVQRALIFVSRSQNLESPHNTTEFAAKVNDGGFYYTPCAGGVSVAGKNDDGGLRSYASMTYAGLKSMIYAGLTKDDPRFQAAHDWITKHYSVDENPGLQERGLYYYYQTFAKTLSMLGSDEFVDASGKKHEWRTELTDKLASLQKENGSWINMTDRFMEGDPNLVTGYCLIALHYCKAPTK